MYLQLLMLLLTLQTHGFVYKHKHMALFTNMTTWFVVDIDECASNPCVNAGVCSNDLNAFSCTCTGGWTGIQCEDGKNIDFLGHFQDTIKSVTKDWT